VTEIVVNRQPDVIGVLILGQLPTLLLIVVLLCVPGVAQKISPQSAKVGQNRVPATGARLEFSPGTRFQDGKAAIQDMRAIYLVNMLSDVVIIGMRINSGPWQPIGPIPQTCSLADEKLCADKKLWEKAGFLPCGRPVTLDVMNQDGEAWLGHAETWDCKWASVWYALHRH
jgi:hypothetical protein